MFEMYDGNFLSLGTVLVGIWFLISFGATLFFVYMFVTKMDREKSLKQNNKNPHEK